ncbi:cysteine dioxygenase family protein [Vreelandella nigrificans]|uniref:Cysteine dioxygenase n=1 Tax=Vreelandella nigrificans TaxID=2042704 RepID=A0A2A4HMC9_9GAMM|nr:cysteine dioxygenase family protein [Halomonas nigrificans]PCF95577.1 cysteine dioxygenase [Halomonas nigrificans]
MSNEQRRQAVLPFLEQVSDITKQGIDRQALANIAALLDALAERQDLFNLANFPAPVAGSGSAATRYRLNDDGDDAPTLYLNAMLPGRKTIPHNHETWAVIAAVQGQELNRVYRRLDDRSDPQRATLELEKEVTVEPRTPIAFLGDDIHSIQVDGEQATLHFHLYGRPLEPLEGRYGIEADGRILNYNASQMAPSTPAYVR